MPPFTSYALPDPLLEASLVIHVHTHAALISQCHVLPTHIDAVLDGALSARTTSAWNYASKSIPTAATTKKQVGKSHINAALQRNLSTHWGTAREQMATNVSLSFAIHGREILRPDAITDSTNINTCTTTHQQRPDIMVRSFRTPAVTQKAAVHDRKRRQEAGEAQTFGKQIDDTARRGAKPLPRQECPAMSLNAPHEATISPCTALTNPGCLVAMQPLATRSYISQCTQVPKPAKKFLAP